MFSALVNTVWGKNIERHEPNELGDNAKTLGSQCAENLANRVQRRITGSDYEPSRWNIDGLGFGRPQGAMRLSLAGKNFYVMKAPPEHGLTPQWDALVNWDSESNTRQALAEATRVALEGYTSHGTAQPGLWPFLIDASPEQIRDFLVVWAGEQTPVSTAGWMTLPIHGAVPFAGVRPLWQPGSGGNAGEQPAEPTNPTGPSFDLKHTVTPTVTLKPRPTKGHA